MGKSTQYGRAAARRARGRATDASAGVGATAPEPLPGEDNATDGRPRPVAAAVATGDPGGLPVRGEAGRDPRHGRAGRAVPANPDDNEAFLRGLRERVASLGRAERDFRGIRSGRLRKPVVLGQKVVEIGVVRREQLEHLRAAGSEPDAHQKSPWIGQ